MFLFVRRLLVLLFVAFEEFAVGDALRRAHLDFGQHGENRAEAGKHGRIELIAIVAHDQCDRFRGKLASLSCFYDVFADTNAATG